MKCYKYLFMITFVISSFLFLSSVKADYKATVLNPTTASCSLKENSTGYCYYANSNLNSLGGIWYLDTGDKVTVLTNYEKVLTKDTNLCPDYYVYTSFYFDSTGKTYNGYYCNAYLKTSVLTDALKTEFRNAKFPESYWEKLAILKTAHPNWSFRAINTQLDFKEAVTNQTYGSKSLLRLSMSNNYAYLDNGASSFDYYKNSYIAYDDTTGSDPWYKANYDAIAYYVDPRNFLSDMYIFQFETLSYDSTVSDDKLKSSINSIFGKDYLAKFTDTFVEAGKLSLVNPIYLASLSKEEVQNGATPGTAINGSYNGMYNFYNIGATGGANPVYRGLDFAANTDTNTLRPWRTEYNAIVGGAKWIYQEYVAPGQDTSYFKKYNVVYNYLVSSQKTPTYQNYSHQYMQNIKAPSSEAQTTYSSYYANNMLNLSYTFYIPVYNNMPASTTLPTKTGWPNNYLSTLTINGKKVAGFDGGVSTYNYYLDKNTTKVSISASPVSSKAKVSGTGQFSITDNTTKTVKVTAQNGDIKNYKINIILTGEKTEEAKDVVTTLNNAGIKNGAKYLSGFEIGTDISVIKNKVLNANSNAIVKLKNSSNKEKNSGKLVTGDKVTVTVDNETKEYQVVIYGDANGDGKISAVDYVKIKNNIMGTSTLSGSYKEAADVDKNGKVSAVDYVKIKNKIMGTGSISQ